MKILTRIMILLFILGLLFISCTKETHPQKLAVLAEISDPYYNMWATDELLFVTDSTDSEKKKTTVMVYSLDNCRLVKRFGGPDIFKIQPAHSVYLFLQPDTFAVNSSGKVSLYDYDFELLKELEHGTDSFFYIPFGENFIARQVYSENKINYYRLNLYDSQLKIIKELCRKEFSGRAFTGDFSFQVFKDNVYVAKQRENFYIEVFDREGNLIKSITHDFPRVKVNQEHRDLHLKSVTSRPGWEKFFNSREEMEEYYRKLIKFPEYFPAIDAIHISDDKIYVTTSHQEEEIREFWILGLEGEVLDRKMIPFKMSSNNIWFPYTIQNNRLYQLILNELTGNWELFSEKLI